MILMKRLIFGREWQASSGQKVPEFASTHPSDSRRIADLKAEMPEAMK